MLIYLELIWLASLAIFKTLKIKYKSFILNLYINVLCKEVISNP